MMSKAEAEEYTRDSYYSDLDFYHGTDAENIEGLTKLLIAQGFDAVEIGGNRILVVIFDRRQIAIYEVTEL